VKISFANGYSNEKGRTPATFSTKNPIIQLAIENSKEFKSGHIYKMHEYFVQEKSFVYIYRINVHKKWIECVLKNGIL